MTGRQFVAVVPEHVQAHGQSAAAVLALLTYWSRKQPDGVVATLQDLAEGTGLSLRTTERAAARLRERGLVTVERAEAWNPTRRWSVVTATSDGHVTATMADSQPATLAVSSTPPEVVEERQSPPATEQGTLPLLVVVPDRPDDPAPEVEQTGPPKTAQTLVARWVDGYRTVNGGADPHKAVLPRVAGQARNLAKACGDDHESWVDAYHATYNAGVAGSHDLVRYLIPQQQRRQSTARRNVWAEPALGGPTAGDMASFQSMMDASRPRVLGGGQ